MSAEKNYALLRRKMTKIRKKTVGTWETNKARLQKRGRNVKEVIGKRNFLKQMWKAEEMNSRWKWKRQRSHIGEKRNNKRQNEEEPISSSVQTSGVLKLSKVSILGPWCPTIPQTAQLPEKISLSIPPPAKAALDPPKPTSDSGPWAWPLFSSPPPDSLPPWILELPGKKNLLGKTIDDYRGQEQGRLSRCEQRRRQDCLKLTCGLVPLLDLLCVTLHQEVVEVWIGEKSFPGEENSVCKREVCIQPYLPASFKSVECLML